MLLCSQRLSPQASAFEGGRDSFEREGSAIAHNCAVTSASIRSSPIFFSRLRVYLRRVISFPFASGTKKCLRALLHQTLRRCAPHRHIIPSRLGGFPSPRRSRLHQRRTNSSGGGAALEAKGALALFARLYLCLLLSVPALPLMWRAVALPKRRTVALGCPQFPAQPLQRALLRRHRRRLGVPQSMLIIVAAPRKLAH